MYAAQDSCLKTNGGGFPVFQGYDGGSGKRIHHQHQAIIPTYKFNCCGNITAWGVDLNPERNGAGQTFDFILQVWRPSTTIQIDSCYSLVNDHKITSTVINSTEPVATVSVTTLNQLQFKPGDVLGFYVESHGSGNAPDGDLDNGVVVLNDSSHTSELVWHGRITSPTSQSRSCPYPVGTSGLLTTSTHAAPVISISVITNSCPISESSFNYVSPSSSYYSLSSDYSLPSPMSSPAAGHHSLSNIHGGLIAGITVTIIVVCVSTLVIISAVVVWKRCTKQTKERTSTGLNYVVTSTALTNQVYGKSQVIM
ncbi:MAG: hypothetical protein MJE68_29575 [Proteobacteria bacterium]|nr:hypothetical protein [Pseudomonadota bacterium]